MGHRGYNNPVTGKKEIALNPTIIIPTYWSDGVYPEPKDVVNSYDHMSDISSTGELPRCLASLRKIKGLCRVILLVVAEPGDEDRAYDKVRTIAESFPDLDILVIGAAQIAAIHERVEEMGLGEFKDAILLSGYGSVRNVGLLVAAILGHTEVIFVDDDEIIDDEEFIEKGLYGLGKLTKRGIPVLAKTGFFYDRRGRYTANPNRRWYNTAWKQDEAFNEWITGAMKGARLSPALSACGGCLAIHYEAFRRVAFDPWISRGEDLDYLLNMRMYGFDIWFDNTWSLRHFPPSSPSEALRFRSDIYRWMYEHRKIEYGRTQIDLLPINPDDLYPYPGPLLKSQVSRKLHTTALLRSLGRREHAGYFSSAASACKKAEEYAQVNCTRFFQFQYAWPELVTSLEGDKGLSELFLAEIADLKEEAAQREVQEMGIEEEAIESLGSAEQIAARWGNRAGHAGKPTTRRRQKAAAKENAPEEDAAQDE